MKNISYISFYKSKIFNKYKSFPINKVKIGDIISFNYNKSEHNKNPHVLVLNPKFENLLHGLVIDYIEYNIFKKIYLGLFNKIKKNNINLENKNNLNNAAQLLYESEIKKNIKKFNINAYRTYNIKDISNLKIIEYNLI